MKRLLAVLAILGTLLSAPIMAQTSSSAITAAISDQTRADTDTLQDKIRLPADLVAFSKVKAGDVVIDVVPGSGHWTASSRR